MTDTGRCLFLPVSVFICADIIRPQVFLGGIALGTWGTKIFQNDDAADLRQSYREKIILGATDEEAEQAVIQEFSISNDFSLWLPLALSQWEIGRLSEKVQEKALIEIEKELSSLNELWKPEHIPKRKKELTDAKNQLCAKPPVRKKLRMPGWAWRCPWQVGSILQFRIQFPKADNPLLGKYVMLQVLGVSETPPGKIPCEAVNVGLYLWHSSISPTEQIKEIEKKPPVLSGFITKAGITRTSWCIMPRGGFHENEIKCIRETPFVPSGIAPIHDNVPSNTMFEEVICRTLLAAR